MYKEFVQKSSVLKQILGENSNSIQSWLSVIIALLTSSYFSRNFYSGFVNLSKNCI